MHTCNTKVKYLHKPSDGGDGDDDDSYYLPYPTLPYPTFGVGGVHVCVRERGGGQRTGQGRTSRR